MRSAIRSIISAVAGLALVFGVQLVPAHAAAPSLNLVISNRATLDGSSLNDYDPNNQYFLTLFVPDGLLSWDRDNTQSGAVVGVANWYTGKGALLQLQGSESQLNAAFAEIHVLNPCITGQVTLYGTVSQTPWLRDPLTGHLFTSTFTTDTYDNQMALAHTMTPGADPNTHGYLATITSNSENIIAASLSQFDSFLGAIDANVDGNFTWDDGPEDGTLFYQGLWGQGGADQTSAVSHWTNFEPNNWANAEPYVVTNWLGEWRDASDSGSLEAVVEWGGQPGDNVDPASLDMQTADVTFTSTGAFEHGTGTQADPWGISDANQMADVARCGGTGNYFVLDNSITLDNWKPLGDYNHPFVGHLDGQENDITFTNTTWDQNYSGLFAVVGTGNNSIDDSSFTNFGLNGDVTFSNNPSVVGLLAGQASNTWFDHIWISQANMTGPFFQGGSLAGYTGGCVFSHIHSEAHITMDTDAGASVDNIGGVVGFAAGDGSQSFLDVTFAGQIQLTNAGNNVNSLGNLGGIAGYVGSMIVKSSYNKGDISSQWHSNNTGGLIGYASGADISESYSWGGVSSNGYRNGGLIGRLDGGSTLSRSYVAGAVLAFGDDYAGGLVGSVYDSHIMDSYTRNGSLDAPQTAGALVGSFGNSGIANSYGAIAVNGGVTNGWYGQDDGNNTAAGVYWVPSVVGVDAANTTEIPGATAITEVQAVDMATYAGWDISTHSDGLSQWVSCTDYNGSYPYLWSTDKNYVCPEPFTNAPDPVVEGAPHPQNQLTVTNTVAWDQGTTWTCVWYADGVALAGDGRCVFFVQQSDIGKTITVDITGTLLNKITTTRSLAQGILITAAPVTPSGPVGSGTAASPLELPADGTFQTLDDTAVGWNRAKGQFSFKSHIIFTGPIKGTLAFKSGGKSYTCLVKFGVLKKAKTHNQWLKSPYLCSGKTEKAALAALKRIAANTVVKLTVWRELHVYNTYKKTKVVTKIRYIKLR